MIEQHAEEAAFLWMLRDAAVDAPHYSLADLAHLDDRVEAHIDGLRIAGEAGWEICKEALGREEAGEVFAAAVLAYESGDANRIQTVLSVGSGSLELSSVLSPPWDGFLISRPKNTLPALFLTRRLASVASVSRPLRFIGRIRGRRSWTRLLMKIFL